MIKVEVPIVNKVELWFLRKEREKKGGTNNKINHHSRHMSYQQKKKHNDASNNMVEGYVWTPGNNMCLLKCVIIFYSSPSVMSYNCTHIFFIYPNMNYPLGCLYI